MTRQIYGHCPGCGHAGTVYDNHFRHGRHIIALWFTAGLWAIGYAIMYARRPKPDGYRCGNCGRRLLFYEDYDGPTWALWDMDEAADQPRAYPRPS